MHWALDDLCPAAVAKVTGSHVVSWTVLHSVSAGHNLTLNGGAHECPQHLHCHSWQHMRRDPTVSFNTSKKNPAS